MFLIEPTAEKIKAAMRAKGYVVFGNEERGYDLNLFGIRSNDLSANTFNDTIGVMYRAAGQWVLFAFPATTDPGVYWRENPMNVDGAAILKPGQYRGAYRIGLHKTYPALQQDAPVTVYRDDDRDDALDLSEDTIQTGMFGINIHRASSKQASSQVNRWSAGCQVIADPAHFDFLLSLCKKSRTIYGSSFTYTLLTEEDLG